MSSNISLSTTRVVDIASNFPQGYYFFQGGRTQVSTATLAPNEIDAVNLAFNTGLSVLRKVSPTIAAEIAVQQPIALLMAQIAKGVLTSTGAPKTITYPSMVGTVGVTWLIPQAIKYTATATTTNPCYTDYSNDLWNISLTAGTCANLLGSATLSSTNIPGTQNSTLTINNRYQAANQANAHQFWFAFQNGLIEIGSTPTLEQFHIETQNANQYGIYTAIPINEQTVEANKTIYQYNTLGVIPVYYDMGINWVALPQVTQTSQLKILGMQFYEHGLFPTLQQV